jgi:hypothetical protein
VSLELRFFSVLVSRLHAAAGALFPPRGEEKKSQVEAECHLARQRSGVGAVRAKRAIISPVRTVLIALIGLFTFGWRR